MKRKVIVLAAGVVVSLFLVARYFALSRLDIPYARGAISDREYRDRRLHIIAGG